MKGVKGSQPSFVITRAEAKRAEWDGQWRLAVVMDALTKPKMREWTQQQFLHEFELSKISVMARLKP